MQSREGAVCDMESLFVTGRLSWTIISVPEASK